VRGRNSRDAFIEVWQAAATLGDVLKTLDELGLGSPNPVSASARAAKLRAAGVELKRFPKGRQGGTGRQAAVVKTKPSMATIHANEDPDWRSPEWVVEGFRELLVEIDLDPASDEGANQTIGAERYFTVDDDGLKQRWCNETGYPSRVFLNPPGRQVLEFWDKLIEEWDANRVLSAGWVGFNVDHLRWLSTRPKHPLGFYTCIPRLRLKFERDGAVGNRPSCANYLTWLPDEDCNENWGRFCDVFGEHGRCIRGSEGFYSGEPYVKHRYVGISSLDPQARADSWVCPDVEGGGSQSSGPNGSPE